MSAKFRLCVSIAMVGSLIGLALTSSPATAGAAPSGAVLSGVDAEIGYFVALGSEDEESFFKNDSDFDVFNRMTDHRLSGDDGVAQARARQSAVVIKGNGDPENGFILKGATSYSEISGYTNASSAEEGVPVADAYSDFNLDFTVNDVAVPFTLVVGSNVRNTDSEDCSDLEVTLSGASLLYRHTGTSGGDCGTPEPDVQPTSGILEPGGYSLSYELGGASAADYDTARFDGSVLVEIRFYSQGCSVMGSDGDDVPLNGTSGPDVICALGGDDEIDGKGGADIIIAGPGDDEVLGGGGGDDIFGDQGNDDINGGVGPDLIAAGNEMDFIEGGADNDKLYGGEHKDKVIGDAGKDDMRGDRGNDVLEGGEGDDTGNGGTGNDTLRGEGGADTLYGDYDSDLLIGGEAKDFLDGGSQHDEFRAKDGKADKVRGRTGTDDAQVDNQLDNVTGVENFI